MSKELYEDLREIQIIAELTEEQYLGIPSALREEMTIKRIDQPNFRSVYESDKEWKERHKEVKKALQERSEVEDKIRANHKIEK